MNSDAQQPVQFFEASIKKWLRDFSDCVRGIDYASALPLVHPDVVAFGTHSSVMHGRENWMNRQWKHIWPATSDFSFDLDRMNLMMSQDSNLVTVAVPWTSIGYGNDGVPFPRPGRATITLERAADTWLCVHSHMSLCRSVSHSDTAAETQPI